MLPPSSDLPQPPAVLPPLLVLLVALPWLQPFAPGPSASVVPLLVAWACSAALLALTPAWPRSLRWWVGAAAAVGASFWLLRASPELLGALAALAAAACCMACTRGLGPAQAMRVVAWGWLLAALASSALALVQFFGWASHLGGLLHPADAGEAYANLRQRNQFATLTSLGLVALLWLARDLPRARWAIPAVLLLAVANAASASRTGLLQWIVVLLLGAWWSGAGRRAWLLLTGGGLAAYLTASLLLPRLLAAVLGVDALNVFSRIGGGPQCGTRTFLWPNILELIGQRPWGGWGWGHLDEAHYLHLYARPRFCDILDNAHNLPLHLAVELGLPVALAVCAAILWGLWKGRPWREADPVRRAAWAALAMLGLHSLVEYPLWYGPFQMAAGLAIGLLVVPSPGALPHVPLPGWRIAFGVAVALVIGAVAADYRRVSQLYLPQEARAPAYREDTQAKVRDSWLFGDHARFAELTMTDVTPANAEAMLALAQRALAFSPEPRVIEKVLDSAWVLRRDAVLSTHLLRYKAAFPQEAQAWLQAHGAVARQVEEGR